MTIDIESLNVRDVVDRVRDRRESNAYEHLLLEIVIAADGVVNNGRPGVACRHAHTKRLLEKFKELAVAELWYP